MATARRWPRWPESRHRGPGRARSLPAAPTSDTDPRGFGLDDIQTTLKANQALGTEYETVHGSVLLRVTGQVKPSRAEAYATAFTS
jgi:hypothetical protein